MRRVGNIGRWAALAVVVGMATACEPPPPPTTFVVDAADPAPDAAPGDGACRTAAGTCTLAAAIDEGNALGRAAVSVPPGTYDLHGETITGAIQVNDREPDAGVWLTGMVTVAAGGALVVDGALSNHASTPVPPSGPLRFRVDGVLVLRNVQQAWAGPAGTLVHVGPTGAALLDTGFVGASFATEPVVVNEGRLWLRHTWLMNIVPDPGAHALLTTGTGVSTTAASAIAPQGAGGFPTLPFLGCGGTPPVSAGHNAFGDTSCGMAATDIELRSVPVSTSSPTGGLDYGPLAGSPLVDAVPLGVHGCGSEPWGDWYQQPRPADGDGDGVPACDIGPKELQGAAAAAAPAAGRTAAGAGPSWALDG